MQHSVAFITLLFTSSFGVEVRVERRVAAPITSVRRAWLDTHWRKGGGVTPLPPVLSDGGRVRTLQPIGMVETLERDAAEPSRTDSIVYRVTDAGAFGPLIRPGTHVGEVLLDGTLLSWRVSFEASSALADACLSVVTRATVGMAANNVAAAAELGAPSLQLSSAAELWVFRRILDWFAGSSLVRSKHAEHVNGQRSLHLLQGTPMAAAPLSFKRAFVNSAAGSFVARLVAEEGRLLAMHSCYLLLTACYMYTHLTCT